MPVLAVIVTSLLLLTILATLFYLLLRSYSDWRSFLGGAPFVSVPLEVAREALRLAKVGKEDIFYDLGCGDGRVLQLAADEFGAKRAVGYEISLWPYLKAKFKIQHSKLYKPNRIIIRRQNLLKADLSEAEVVFLYLYPQLLEKLKEELATKLPKNARVIVVTWGFGHPFGKPSVQKIIPWQPQDFTIFVFVRMALSSQGLNKP